MGHDEAGVDLALNDLFQERLSIGLNMGLSSLECKPFVHRRAERCLVAHSNVHARNRDRTSFATTHDCLAKHTHTISGKKCRGFHFVDGGVSCTMAGCLAAHRIDAAIGTAVVD